MSSGRSRRRLPLNVPSCRRFRKTGRREKNVNLSSSFDLESKRTFFGGNLLAHIFDELKYALSMHQMSSRVSKRMTEQWSGPVRIGKREESLERDSQVQGSIYEVQGQDKKEGFESLGDSSWRMVESKSSSWRMVESKFKTARFLDLAQFLTKLHKINFDFEQYG